MSGHDDHRPLGGPVFTPSFFILLSIIAAGAVLVLYRLVNGLGAVSAMNDGYAWGIWKPLNVVTFTGIGAGAYAVGLLTYVFNRWHYHGLVRSAIVVGAMAYTLGGTSVPRSNIFHVAYSTRLVRACWRRFSLCLPVYPLMCSRGTPAWPASTNRRLRCAVIDENTTMVRPLS